MAELSITNADKARSAKREAGLRRRVYPRWVENGRLSQDQADREIAVMEAIQADYERLAEADRQAATPTML